MKDFFTMLRVSKSTRIKTALVLLVVSFLAFSCASGPDTSKAESEPEVQSSEMEESEKEKSKSDEVIEVFPVGSAEPTSQHPLGHGPCTEDVMNVQKAVLKAAKTGQTVVLKADGDKPFNFGVFVPKTGDEWLSCGVHLFTGVSIEGEEHPDGNRAIIENGHMAMRGFNLKGSGTVTIKGIHFKNFGGVAIYIEGVSQDVTVHIRDNKITADYYERFSGTEKLDQYINTDVPELVDGPMSPQKDPGLYMKALEKLIFMPVFDFQDQGGDTYPAQEWWSYAINSQKVKGSVVIEDNYIDLEEGSTLPSEDTHVWWHTVGLLYGTVHGSIVNRGNTIKNTTSTACGGITLYGERLDENNYVELGPLASYELEKPISKAIAIGHHSIVGICAHNNMCTLTDVPLKMGHVTFKNNEIACLREADALPLGILGGGGHTFEKVQIVGNKVVLENGSTGITVKDTEDALIARNILSGNAAFGIKVGSTEKIFPRNTDSNIFENNDLSGLTVSNAHVYFDSDTHNNEVIGGKGTVIDRGKGNVLEGEYSPASGE